MACDAYSGNILLNDELAAKLSDYGITRRGPSTNAGSTSTSTNVIVGTMVYMAPEYLTSGRVSDKIDSYSYAVVCTLIHAPQSSTHSNTPGQHLINSDSISINSSPTNARLLSKTCVALISPSSPNHHRYKLIYLFIIKIVHEVQQEKLKYTKETEQYTALGYQSLSTNAVNNSGNLISIKQVSAQIKIVSKEPHILQHGNFS